MIESCSLIYPLVDLRHGAREGVFDEATNAKIPSLPLSHLDLAQIAQDNKDALLDTKFAKELCLQTLRVTQEQSVWSPTEIVACDDEYEKEELVCSVEVNHTRQRVTACFRGSIAKLGWATNYEMFMKEVTNPMNSHATQSNTIKLHNGFHDYLLTPTARGTKGPDGELLSEHQEIMCEHVPPVLKEYPDYKLQNQ